MNNREIAKLYKEKRYFLMKELEESDPDFIPGKKLVFYSLTTIIALMLINLVLGISFHVKYNIAFTSKELFILVWPLFLSFVFARLIYSFGSKIFIFLLLLGGIAGLCMAYINNVFTFLNTESLLLNMISTFTIITALIQIISMLFILMNKKCKTYFRLRLEYNKKLSEELKTINDKVNVS